MKKLGMLTALLGFYISISAAASETKGVTKATQRATPAAKEHFTVTTKTVKWGPPPPDMVVGTLPAEFQNQPPISVAVLSGDPTKPGVPFVLWIKNPAGYRVAPHWHPTDEHITMIQGTYCLGVGDKFDESRCDEMPAGSYAFMPKRMHHFAMAKTEAIGQAHGIGPFKIVWVNPAITSGKKP
jgi:hypothetical protein